MSFSEATASSSSSTPLQPTKSSSGFIFPPIWSFPPFYTLQPSPSTLAHQIGLWKNLVLSWAKHARVFVVDCENDEPGEVFRNKAIDRRLLPASLKVVLASMAKDGQAAADPPKSTSNYLIYWKRPDEWGNLIYAWVTENGLNASIMTFYELTDGDLSHTTEFYQLPTPLLRRALDTLVKKGKAQIFKGEDEAGEGVRFL
ncbi:ESCRT-II complex subunit VPS25, partial [Tremellales sp. Uapishka_1]